MQKWGRFPTAYYEEVARKLGYIRIAGVDEVGRGCLAGPVVACAVILPEHHGLKGLADSKLLSPKQRNILRDMICKTALAIGLGSISSQEIDEINILQATRRAMVIAIEALQPAPDYILVDGIFKPLWKVEQKSLPSGDALCESIAAASIVAKVFRDEWMKKMDAQYPQYGFAVHKGYPTSYHREAIRKVGPSEVHRKTFQGVREYVGL